jgi:hypothetical protein
MAEIISAFAKEVSQEGGAPRFSPTRLRAVLRGEEPKDE